MKKEIIAYLLISAVIVIGDLFYRDPLYETSLNSIASVQGNEMPFVTYIFISLSYILPGAVVFAAIMVITFMQVERSFYFLLSVCFSNFFIGIMKIAYAAPRPYWVADHVNALGCNREYGDPSGHSFNVSFIFIVLYLMVFHDYYEEPNQRRGPEEELKTQYNQWLLGVIECVVTFSIGLLGFSRIYLGVHSVDQVLYGIQLGVILAFIFHNIIRRHVYKRMRHFYKNIENYRLKTTTAVAIVNVGFLAFLVANTLVYFIADNMITVDNQWIDSIYRKCGYYPLNQMFHYKSYVDNGLSAAVFGGLTGLLLEAKMGFSREAKEPRNKIKGLIMCLINVSIGAISFTPYMFTPGSTNLAIQSLLASSIPAWLAAFFISAFANWLFASFKLIKNTNDVHVEKAYYNNRSASVESV